ncbi:MAG: histidine kinase [Solirubrobacterales bacterium]|nr:histidine kinase [Solirubrobacterales bacterium]
MDLQPRFCAAVLGGTGLVTGLLAGSALAVLIGLTAAVVVELGCAGVARRERCAAHTAVAAERRRLARELHDGLAQDLAFISSCGRHLASRPGGERLLRALSAAAAQALAETRRAIVGLDECADDDLRAAVEQGSAELADRFGVEITVRSDEGALRDAPPGDVIRLVREAVSNAARHGGARRVEIELGGIEEGRMLSVRDDGRGMDPQRPPRAGSRGLLGMEERAARLGGRLLTRSRPEGGTEVLVLKGPAERRP